MIGALGGEAGCRRLSAAFYARVGKDPVLRPLFPGKTLKCAIEEFAAFLIQFLGGDEEHTQRRWWLSLRESHARFRIGHAERRAWLNHMGATLDATPLDEVTRNALRQFFERSSAYVAGTESAQPEHDELAARWREQRVLDDVIAAIAAGRDQEAMALAPRFLSRPSVFVGLLARMVQSGRADLIGFAIDAVERDPSLAPRRFGGRTLLHYASGAGCLEVVSSLLEVGADPEMEDGGSHTPLYSVANECASETGPTSCLRSCVRVLTSTRAAESRGRRPFTWPRGEVTWKSRGLCWIAARPLTRGTARAIRHCSERLIAAGPRWRSCWSNGALPGGREPISSLAPFPHPPA